MILAKKQTLYFKTINLIFILIIFIGSINCQNDGASTSTSNTANVGIPASDVGTPAMDVGVAASDVGTPAMDVGTPASDVGTPVTQALPPAYTDAEMTFHVAGKTSKLNGSDIEITSPTSSTTWISNQTGTVTWTGTTPDRLSIQLINDNTSVLESGLSLRASVETSDGSATCILPVLKSGNNYFIRLYDQLDISKTLATSDKFSIRDQTSIPFQPDTGIAIVGSNPIPSNGEGITNSTNTTTTTGSLPGKNGASIQSVFELPLLSAIIIIAISCIWL